MSHTASLYHRINELVEEVRSLKTANESLRKEHLRMSEDRGHLLTRNDELADQNLRLSNENSSLKFASVAGHRGTYTQGFIAFIGSGYNSRGRFPQNLTELEADIAEYAAKRSGHPTMAFAGTVAE